MARLIYITINEQKLFFKYILYICLFIFQAANVQQVLQDIKASNQMAAFLGNKVEMAITKAVEANKSVLKVGLHFEFGDCRYVYYYLRLNKLLTSLKADLCQDINKLQSQVLHLANALMEFFLYWKCSVKAFVSYLRREDLYLLLFSFGLMYQCLNGAIPSRKCQMKKLCLCLDGNLPSKK